MCKCLKAGRLTKLLRRMDMGLLDAFTGRILAWNVAKKEAFPIVCRNLESFSDRLRGYEMPDLAIKRIRELIYGYWFCAIPTFSRSLYGESPFRFASQVKKLMSTAKLFDLVAPLHASYVLSVHGETPELASGLIEGVAAMYKKPDQFVEKWDRLLIGSENVTVASAIACSKELDHAFGIPESFQNQFVWREPSYCCANGLTVLFKDNAWSQCCEEEIRVHLRT